MLNPTIMAGADFSAVADQAIAQLNWKHARKPVPAEMHL